MTAMSVFFTKPLCYLTLSIWHWLMVRWRFYKWPTLIQPWRNANIGCVTAGILIWHTHPDYLLCQVDCQNTTVKKNSLPSPCLVVFHCYPPVLAASCSLLCLFVHADSHFLTCVNTRWYCQVYPPARQIQHCLTPRRNRLRQFVN